MLSTKLVRLIEEHWEELAERLIRALKTHPDIQTLAERDESELREWSREILANLSYLLSARKDEDVRRRFELLGRIRFEEHVPLHEAVLRLQLLKDLILEFVHNQGLATTAVELYVEEELELRMGRFFDAAVYRLVRGYEQARQLEIRIAS